MACAAAPAFPQSTTKPSLPDAAPGVERRFVPYDPSVAVVLSASRAGTHQWAVTTTPDGAVVTPRSGSGSPFRFTYDRPGRYGVRLVTISPAGRTETTFEVVTSVGGINAEPAPGVLVADGQDRRVYRYGWDGGAAGEFPLAGTNAYPTGVARDADWVYVLDAVDRAVYRYTIDGTPGGVSRPLRLATGLALGLVRGLAVDGDDLWVVDRTRMRICRYSLERAFAGSSSLPAIDEIPLAATNRRAEGLAADPSWLYVVDAVERRVHRYPRRPGGTPQSSRVMRGPTGAGLGGPTGAMLDGFFLLVVDAGRDRIFAYTLADLFGTGDDLRAYAELPLAAGNTDARGL